MAHIRVRPTWDTEDDIPPDYDDDGYSEVQRAAAERGASREKRARRENSQRDTYNSNSRRRKRHSPDPPRKASFNMHYSRPQDRQRQMPDVDAPEADYDSESSRVDRGYGDNRESYRGSQRGSYGGSYGGSYRESHRGSYRGSNIGSYRRRPYDEDLPADYNSDDKELIRNQTRRDSGLDNLGFIPDNDSFQWKGYLADPKEDRRNQEPELPDVNQGRKLSESSSRLEGIKIEDIADTSIVVVPDEVGILKADEAEEEDVQFSQFGGLQRRHSKWFARYKRGPQSSQSSTESERARARGRDLSRYQKWKRERAKEFKRFKVATQETLDNLQIWQGSFKSIEGRFGSSVLAYFRFLKWLFLLNLLLAILILAVIVLPQVAMGPRTFNESVVAVIPGNKNNFVESSLTCTAEYAKYNASSNIITPILDFIQGTGWMERTPLFYGYYYNRTYTNIITKATVHYNMSVGYLLAVLAYFIISLLLMVFFTAKGMKNRITSGQDQLYKTCNKVFCGWDFSLNDPESADYKHSQLNQEYMRDLAILRRKEELRNQSTAKKALVIFVRAMINFIVIGILVGSGYLIYYMTTQSIKWLTQSSVNDNAFLKLAVEFSPSLTITVLNFVVPLIFQRLVLVEDYSPTFEIRITIIRSVILRLASVAVLITSVGGRILGCDIEDSRRCQSCETVSLCWETYIGQQFYKLVLLDFVTVVIMTFFVQFPRRLIVGVLEKRESKLSNIVTYEEFEIPKEVLNIVYSQTLCWIGSFLCPMILCMTVAKFFCFFYLKKMSLLYNCKPATRLYRASSSQTFFMSILLGAFVLCAIPVAFAIGKIPPSYSCGPFRIYSREEYFMFNAVTDLVGTWPAWIRDIIKFIADWTFILPMTILLCLVIYYYVSVAAGKRAYIKVLLQQLSLATKDKQFLVHEALARREYLKTD